MALREDMCHNHTPVAFFTLIPTFDNRVRRMHTHTHTHMYARTHARARALHQSLSAFAMLACSFLYSPMSVGHCHCGSDRMANAGVMNANEAPWITGNLCEHIIYMNTG